MGAVLAHIRLPLAEYAQKDKGVTMSQTAGFAHIRLPLEEYALNPRDRVAKGGRVISGRGALKGYALKGVDDRVT
ncbi:hypothetical protein V501_01506 [Pseudogymnoascus sp. VKM F-4519 (FW-2642)]|nr:hypothetical protein V501_01506 [Pseudogymnoascus sp. VKM F-4519 (FW-2642)]